METSEEEESCDAPEKIHVVLDLQNWKYIVDIDLHWGNT